MSQHFPGVRLSSAVSAAQTCGWSLGEAKGRKAAHLALSSRLGVSNGAHCLQSTVPPHSSACHLCKIYLPHHPPWGNPLGFLESRRREVEAWNWAFAFRIFYCSTGNTLTVPLPLCPVRLRSQEVEAKCPMRLHTNNYPSSLLPNISPTSHLKMPFSITIHKRQGWVVGFPEAKGSPEWSPPGHPIQGIPKWQLPSDLYLASS